VETTEESVSARIKNRNELKPEGRLTNKEKKNCVNINTAHKMEIFDNRENSTRGQVVSSFFFVVVQVRGLIIDTF